MNSNAAQRKFKENKLNREQITGQGTGHIRIFD